MKARKKTIFITQEDMMKKTGIAALLVLASLSLAACGGNDNSGTDSTGSAASSESSQATSDSAAPANVTIAEGKAPEGTEVPGAGTVIMRQMYAAPHGTKSFAAVNVTMNGDTIVTARLDEFQYVEPGDFKGVPNADAGFGESFPDGNILVGKEENDDAYSAMMKDHGGATQTWKDSMEAITNFVKGKTVADVEAAIKELEGQGDDAKPADVVTGSTFSDTRGYLQAIVDTAKSGMISVGEKSDTTDLKEAQTLSAPHGDKSFAVTTVAMDGDKVAAVFVDEFQFVEAADFGGVPNSDSDFGQGVKNGQVLASKEANNEAYSAMMKDHAGATQTYSDNMKAVEDFVIGKTIADIEKAISELEAQGDDAKPADVVTGATFADTKGYLQAIVDTAKNVN